MEWRGLLVYLGMLPQGVGYVLVTSAPAPEQLKLLALSLLPTSTAASTAVRWHLSPVPSTDFPKMIHEMSVCQSCSSPGCPVSSSAFITSSGCPLLLGDAPSACLFPTRAMWSLRGVGEMEAGSSPLKAPPRGAGARCSASWQALAWRQDYRGQSLTTGVASSLLLALGCQHGFAFLSVCVGTSTLPYGLCGWDLRARGHTLPGSGSWLSVVQFLVAFPDISMKRSCFEVYS